MSVITLGLVNKAHRYSYSQLEQVSECPYSFYLERIEEDNKDKLVGNSFASQGTLIHDLLDKWAKRELSKDQLISEYKRRYPIEVENNWPRMLAAKGYAEKTYNAGLDYFENFDEFEGYKVVASEQKFITRLFDRQFVGIIDMILQDVNTGEFIILDHKSKSLSSFKKAENSMYRQQFLYSKYFYEKYNAYPDRLMFNLFKENGLKMQRQFDGDAYNNTLEWAKEQIEKIENYELLDWFTTKEGADVKPDFFCHEICSCRKICPNGVS